MDFAISEEQRMFQDSMRKFAQNEVSPRMEEFERAGEFPWPCWKKMAEFGIMGLPFPEEYGGQGADIFTTLLGMEALGEGGCGGGLALAWGAHTVLCGVPIWLIGNEAQKKKYLTKIATAEYIGAFGLTEPNVGSDAASVETTAVKKGDKWIINGAKMFITNGPIADICIVIASTNKAAKHFGISAFIVEKNFPGYAVGRELDKMGVRTSTTSELVFEDCEVPAENMLGQEGFGFVEVGKTILEWERSCLLASGVGGMKKGIEICAKYAKQRVQFGRPIAEFQAIQKKLAEMRVIRESARQIMYKVACMKRENVPAMLEACIAKLFVSEMGLKYADHAVQIHGGYGYMKEYPVEWGYRDAKLGTIGGGTSEIQRRIISQLVLNLKKGGKK